MSSICITSDSGGKTWRNRFGDLHREDGSAIEYVSGQNSWYINGDWIDPKRAVHDPVLRIKYPKLIEAMVIHSVHDL
jgi:hypothetical protein